MKHRKPAGKPAPHASRTPRVKPGARGAVTGRPSSGRPVPSRPQDRDRDRPAPRSFDRDRPPPRSFDRDRGGPPRGRDDRDRGAPPRDRSGPPRDRGDRDRAPRYVAPTQDSRDALTAPLLADIPTPYEVLHGMNPVREALLAGRRKVRRLYLSRREDSPETEALLKLAAEKSVVPQHVDREVLDAIVAVSAGSDAIGQGVALVVTPYRYYSLEEMAGVKGEGAGRRRLLALDEIEDPRNLGAMARTAEAAGFRGLLVQEHRAAAVTATAAKASAGAVEHLRIARETNLASSLERLKEHGYWIVGLEAEGGGDDIQDIYKVDLDMDLVLVIGAEGRGIRPRVRSICDLRVRLPMAGRVGSLNASAACAAAVYQVLRADSR